jgi:hypothetical protein
MSGLRTEQVYGIAQTIDQELTPLLALHWKQWFCDYLPPLPHREPVLLGDIRLPEIPDDYSQHSVYLVSPRYLEMINLLVEMYCSGGPYALYPEERSQFVQWIVNDSRVRERILAYAKHLTKIKLTRNIL